MKKNKKVGIIIAILAAIIMAIVLLFVIMPKSISNFYPKGYQIKITQANVTSPSNFYCINQGQHWDPDVIYECIEAYEIKGNTVYSNVGMGQSPELSRVTEEIASLPSMTGERTFDSNGVFHFSSDPAQQFVWANWGIWQGIISSALSSGGALGSSGATEIADILGGYREIFSVDYESQYEYLLGPFNYTFPEGDTMNCSVYLDGMDVTGAAQFVSYYGMSPSMMGSIQSGQDFYIKIPASVVGEATSISIDISITKLDKSANINVFTPVSNTNNQEMILVNAGEELVEIRNSFSYRLNLEKEVTIQKTDENGNPFSVSGISFEIYKATGGYAGTLVTDGSGRTSTIKLRMKTDYIIKESGNTKYGYKGSKIADAYLSSGEGTVRANSDGTATINISDDSVITIKNKRELGNLEIVKIGEDGTPLPNVEFVIEIGSGQYLQLSGGGTITGSATINPENESYGGGYHVEYVSRSAATVFKTDSNGRIHIGNLEVNQSKDSKYSYTAHEIYNPNYGYGSTANISKTGSVYELIVNGTSQIQIVNDQDLGAIQLEKYDKDNQNIKLENVAFKMIINGDRYIALYNQNNNFVSEIRGTATIDKNNRGQYRVEYSNTNYTKFITDSSGTITVNNLEVYSDKGETYTYQLEEISNENYGFSGEAFILDKTESITLISDRVSKVGLGNQQVLTNITGYVWLDNPGGKANAYNGIYTENSEDIKLTESQNGKLVLKYNGKTTYVEIKLREKSGKIIKEKPDRIESDGKYVFADLLIENISNYEVVFVYDGFYYTTIMQQLDQDNGSKVGEEPDERAALNNKFKTIQSNGQVVATDGTVNRVEYTKDGHSSTVSKLNFDTTLSANTTEVGLNLKNRYDEIKNRIKSPTNQVVKELHNVNMGLVLREQPKLAIGSDIHSVLVEVNGYNYTYYYNGRQNHYENLNGDKVGVKFEQENALQRYTRTVYSSDVQAIEKLGIDMKVSILYKIKLINQSRTLTSVVNEITNYYDADYTIEAIGNSLDGNNKIVTNADYKNNMTTTEGVSVTNAEAGKSYKASKIPVGIQLKAEENKDVYIKFSVSQNAIKGLLNKESTYHNATEITSYSTYYGLGTSNVDGRKFITDSSNEGALYAGIDKSSQPGNIQLVLVNSQFGGGTRVLDTTNFEDDTTSAPSFILEATESRKLSGKVWEDLDADTSGDDEDRLGNGIIDSSEKPIQNVKVKLLKADGTQAKYSNNTLVETVTDESGNYKFGYYNATENEYYGVIPDRYIIEYTYNNESVIVGKENINVNDYKSTIITSEIIKNALEGNDEQWYLEQESNRYSDAVDDFDLRKSLDGDSIKYSTYYDSTLPDYVMNAYTPIMDVGIEFTKTNEAEMFPEWNRIVEQGRIDFGIIERPDIRVSISKDITSIEVFAQNGATIIPKGDPSNPDVTIPYVRTGLDGVVPVEIEAKLLQNAQLKLEYTIKMSNNSQVDYDSKDYYYYGRVSGNLKVAKIEKVVDYLDNTLEIDGDIENDGVWTTITGDELKAQGLIKEDVHTALNSGNYKIMYTTGFNSLTRGSTQEVKLYVRKALAVTDSIEEKNRVEIIEYTGGRAIKDTIPGNYNPATISRYEGEADDDRVDLIITPPTGTATNYVLYALAGIATLTILAVGIVFIKKKIIK